MLDLLTREEVERLYGCSPEELNPDMLVRDGHDLVEDDGDQKPISN